VIISENTQSILNSLDSSIVMVGPNSEISYLNNAAEQLFSGSHTQLLGAKIETVLPANSPILLLIKKVQNTTSAVSDYGITLDTPRILKQIVNIQISPFIEDPNHVILNIFTRSIADKIDKQLIHRNAARSITAIASTLGHEIKNPLSGIKGAAQLLGTCIRDENRELTQLICDESDRICSLIDRMEIFSDKRPVKREPVNAHKVLERVRLIAENGVAKKIKFIEQYDPSLPFINGDHDQLIQIFLNLIKNAAESINHDHGEIILRTAYQHGVKFALPGDKSQFLLPLVISIQDNGVGVPRNLNELIFDAFVTSKSNGTGLGLALVAKLIDDHGGALEFDSEPGRTIFKVLLPMHKKEIDDEVY